MAAEQDQNSPADATTQEIDDLVLALREIIASGPDLTARKCAKLTALKKLQLVLSAESPRPRTRNDKFGAESAISPENVQNAVAWAIGKIEKGRRLTPALEKHYKKIRLTLFGLTEETRHLPTDERWERAQTYYESHLAYDTRRKVPMTKNNFRLRVCGKEVLPQIAEALLDREFELRAADNPWGIELRGEIIQDEWEKCFHWLFRVKFHAIQAIKSMTGEELPGSTPWHSSFLKMAIFDISILLSFAHLPRPIINPNLQSMMTANSMLDSLSSLFDFGEEDQIWLIGALSRPDTNSRRNFVVRLDDEPLGRQVFEKVLLVHGGCDCPNGREQPYCRLHGFISHIKRLEKCVNDDWTQTAFLLSLPMGDLL